MSSFENSGITFTPKNDDRAEKARIAAERRVEALTKAFPGVRKDVTKTSSDPNALIAEARGGFRSKLEQIVRSSEGPVVKVGPQDLDEDE